MTFFAKLKSCLVSESPPRDGTKEHMKLAVILPSDKLKRSSARNLSLCIKLFLQASNHSCDPLNLVRLHPGAPGLAVWS